ncbi:hypothetical protein DPMN_140675 [Dreissena polymorpha]|uniref:Uncharacterized protein n=1 Tax=Dreissena polymorpha TaxID=45954 RepID=A0A9D4G821_DREPO|nr:hypothetical protein DPMN_140675 [Dreissena polymorpha]
MPRTLSLCNRPSLLELGSEGNLLDTKALIIRHPYIYPSARTTHPPKAQPTNPTTQPTTQPQKSTQHPTDPPTHLSIDSFIHPSSHQSIDPSTHPSNSPSICPSIHPS